MIRKKKGFTLIELLVVISIIALLLSILVPSLSRAKDVAKKTVCQSQQKQWGTATQAYSIENNDAIPFFSTVGGYIDKNANNILWFQKLTPYLGEQERKDEYSESFAAESRRCPAGRRGNPDDLFVENIWNIRMDGWQGWIGPIFGLPGQAPFYYSHQWAGAGGPAGHPAFRLSNVSRASDCLLYMDVNTFYMYHPGDRWSLNEDYDKDGMLDSSNLPYDQEGLLYNCARPKIHYGGCNVTLADGHSEYIKFEELWSNGKNEKAVWEMHHRYWDPVP